MGPKNCSAIRKHLYAVLICIIFISGGYCGAQERDSPPSAIPDAPVAKPAPAKPFLARLEQFYREDWRGTAAAGPAAPRRGLESPLPSPPFYSVDWSYGGSPTIGEADTNSYPLMTAINGATSRTKVYGWVEPGLNFSTSGRSNLPVVDDIYPNRLELDQVVLFVERLPDTVQRDHVDWGYHLTGLYGNDYRLTMDKGYLGTQWLRDKHQYGFDPTTEYVDLYLPHVAKGMNIRAGRFLSLPGIESQFAQNNYMFSHSLLYSVDPFTDTGVIGTVQLNDQWLVQLGLTDGHDVALWTPDAQASGTACVDYTTKSVDDNFYVCANGINDAKYAYNNVQQYDATWYHKFSKTVHMATEAWYMYERDVPAVGGPIQPQTNTNGAVCLPGETRCTAPAYAIVNYLEKQASNRDLFSFRCDFLNDKKGQRTGFATRYSENTIMWGHWFGSTVEVRPELRFDHAWDAKAYDLGTKQSQLTVASDVIFHF